MEDRGGNREGGARAEVIERISDKEICLRVSGRNKKELISIVAYELEKIHSTFRQLKYMMLVPCSCLKCAASGTPYFFELDTLKRFLADGQIMIQCFASYQPVDVRRLIDDVGQQNDFEALRHRLSNQLNEASEFTSTPEKVAIYGPVNNFIFRPAGPTFSDRHTSAAPNAWINGSFYVFVVVAIFGFLGFLVQFLPLYLFIPIFIGGALLVPTVGALQLMQDGRFSEKSFLQLMRLSLSHLPLLGRFVSKDVERDE